MRIWAAPVSRIALRAALPRGYCRVGNASALPNRVDQLIPADHPSAVSDQMDKEVGELRFERDQITGVTQFAPFVSSTWSPNANFTAVLSPHRVPKAKGKMSLKDKSSSPQIFRGGLRHGGGRGTRKSELVVVSQKDAG